VRVCKRLQIHGRVQGVGFRYWFADRARELKLAGWVRNRLDGSVEAMLDGESEAVEQMIAEANTGPEGARVDALQASDAAGNFDRFEILRTR
jgi:acylphosphatase